MEIVNLTRAQVLLTREALDQYFNDQSDRASGTVGDEAQRNLYLYNAATAQVALMRITSALDGVSHF
jgi:hypothetical protein